MNASRPFRLTAPPVAEDDLQAAVADCLDLVLLAPAQWCAMPVGHVQLAPAQAARLSRIGVKRGWPDVLVLHQTLFGIELKRPGSPLSKTKVIRTRSGAQRELIGQSDQFPRLIDAGMRIAVCHSVEEVLQALRGWNVPLRRVT